METDMQEQSEDNRLRFATKSRGRTQERGVVSVQLEGSNTYALGQEERKMTTLAGNLQGTPREGADDRYECARTKCMSIRTGDAGD
jgi:hypothetical protein